MVVGSIPTAPAISRRGFLVGAAATAVAAPSLTRAFFGPPRGGWPVGGFTTDNLRYKVYERYAQGWTEPGALYGTSGCDLSEFRRIVEPGARKVWDEAYSNHCQEYERLYQDDGIALRSTSHPGGEMLTEEDQQLVEDGGWKCVNGHPYCNRCASPVNLTEQSLEEMLIDIHKKTDRFISNPKERWFLKIENPDGLQRFERKSPIRISTGRHWWK